MSPECTRVLECLGEPLPPELEAHVASCAECQAVRAGFAALPSPPSASTSALEASRARALEELAAHPKVTPWWVELLVLLGVYAGVMGVGALALVRVGLFQNAAPLGVVVGLAALLTLVMVGGAVLALAPTRRVAWGLVGTSTAVVGLAVLLGGSGVAARGFLAGVIGCCRTSLLLSALPIVAAVVMLRRSAFYPARALAAGLSAGSVGLLLLHVHCPDGSAAHLAASHLGPWLLLGALALLVRSSLPTYNHAP